MQRQGKYNKKIAYSALLLSLAIVLSYVDSLFSSLLPLPGLRLGLANIVVMFAFFKIGKAPSAVISFLRIVLISMLFGNVSSFLFSVMGATCAYIALFSLSFFQDRVSRIGISIASAALHSLGQIFAACLIYGTLGLVYYLPYLLIMSLPLGVLTGTLLIVTENKLSLKI